jgi:hypothetical protein
VAETSRRKPSAPPGIRVRIEDAQPAMDDAYRRCEPEPGRLVIEHRWRHTSNVPGLVIGGACLALVVGVLFVFFGFSLWLMLASGVVIARWVTGVSAWSTTKIVVDGEHLVVVEQGPTPDPTLWKISRRDLQKIHCKLVDEEPYYFCLVARLRNGQELPLTVPLPESAPYEYAARQISDYLERPP